MEKKNATKHLEKKFEQADRFLMVLHRPARPEFRQLAARGLTNQNARPGESLHRIGQHKFASDGVRNFEK